MHLTELATQLLEKRRIVLLMRRYRGGRRQRA